MNKNQEAYTECLPMLSPNSLCTSPAEQLNRACFCTTLDRQCLLSILQADHLNQDILATHPQLFSSTSVYISAAQLQSMQDIIRAVTQLVNLPLYVPQVSIPTENIAPNTITGGVVMGYDFHLSEQGPKLIEINTNAGGIFLNSTLFGAQRQCCNAEDPLLPQGNYDQKILAMFLDEWQLQRGNSPLTTIAIVDSNPTQQFLYPEFKMAQRLFERNGITAIIADPAELHYFDNRLYVERDGIKQGIDLVYNRLTDFTLAQAEHRVLRQAYEHKAVVVTPNPLDHAFYADKRNLVAMSNSAQLKAFGANEQTIAILHAGIAHTQRVCAENAEALWAARKQLFFKPASGYGSRAAYRGDKITTRVWSEILQGDYVAQQLIAPSLRGVRIDGQETTLKMDVRAYVYAGEIQLIAARLYQGQTTNFRTQGGGFASVFIAP